MSNLGPAETENSSSVSSRPGSPAGASGYFIEPTVLSNTRPGMKVVREEISGLSARWGHEVLNNYTEVKAVTTLL